MNQWLISVDPAGLLISGLALLGVFLFRKNIANWVMAGISKYLRHFSIEIPKDVSDQIKLAIEVLSVTFVVYVIVGALNLPDLTDGFLRHCLNSIVIVAIFSTWYQLSGPFASLLHAKNVRQVSLETDWVQRVTQFAILLFGITALLSVWKIDISGALTGVGMLGAGLAIATRDLLQNLVAGMSNIREKRFETGDVIEVDNQFIGTVKRIDLRSTLVVGFDQIPRYIPNSDLSNSIVLNYSGRQHRRIYIKVPLVLSSTREQIEAVRNGLKEYLLSSGDFDLGEDAPKHVFVSELTPNSVNILFYAWTDSPDYSVYLNTLEGLTLTIMDIVSTSGSELAYPTQTIKINEDSVSHMEREFDK